MSVTLKQFNNSVESSPNSENPSSEKPKLVNQSQINTENSVYSLADSRSILSNDVDYWIRGSLSPTETTGVQGSGVVLVQRSTLVTPSMEDANGLWYLVAMMLPLVSVNHGTWRATPSTILYTAEILLLKLSRMCGRIGFQIRHLADNHFSRETFATAMDIVLVVYAIGFLILSMYQASITRAI